MAIPDEDVAAVRTATDIVGLIGERTALKKSGRRWSGLCPFHDERSPSFSVNAEDGLYHCFGCKASGDAIKFVRETQHLGFAEAVRLLADRAGVTIREDARSSEAGKRRSVLMDAVAKAVDFYHERLLTSPDAGAARQYLRSRGLDGEMVRRFKLGWAPAGWDELASQLSLSNEVLSESGLGFVNRRGKQQDAFRSRVVFPIMDPSDRPIAIGARILPGAPVNPDYPEPKYKNSIETTIYAKSRTLYALNWAKQDIIRSGQVVVCEGYTDVIGCFKAGLPRAVATCGTSLTEQHFTLLKNFAKEIVLAYDADSAGQNAAARLYELERKHDVALKVAALPPGEDPGSLAESNPEALVAAIEGAVPFLAFQVDRTLAGSDLATYEGQDRAATAALQVIADHPSSAVADKYLLEVAARCRIDEQELRRRLADLKAKPRPVAPTPTRRDAPPPGDDPGPEPPPEADDHLVATAGLAPRGSANLRPGLEALRLTVHHPDAVGLRLEAALFADPLQRRAFEALLEADDIHAAIGAAGPEVGELLSQVVNESPLVESELGDPIDAVVRQLVELGARRALDDLATQLRVDPGAVEEASRQVAEVRGLLEALSSAEPATAEAAERQLVAWICAREEARRG